MWNAKNKTIGNKNPQRKYTEDNLHFGPNKIIFQFRVSDISETRNWNIILGFNLLTIDCNSIQVHAGKRTSSQPDDLWGGSI